MKVNKIQNIEQRLEHLESVINEKKNYTDEQVYLIKRFIFEILISNVVESRFACSYFGNVIEGKTVRLNDCINYFGKEVLSKEDE